MNIRYPIYEGVYRILTQVKRNWQEEPSYEAVPTTVHCICKTSKRFRRKGIEKRKINNQ